MADLEKTETHLAVSEYYSPDTGVAATSDLCSDACCSTKEEEAAFVQVRWLFILFILCICIN
jgi:hypothetical protein